MEIIVTSVGEPFSGEGESGTRELRHLVHVSLAEKEETVPWKMISFSFSFFSQDLGEWRLDGGIREKLKTISVNWVQLTDIRGQKMLLSVSGGVRQVDERC